MNYDLNIINPFQTLHGLVALWDKIYTDNKVEGKVFEEMNEKL